MPRLEDLVPGVSVRGLLPGMDVTVTHTEWRGDQVIELWYRDAEGNTGDELIYRDSVDELEVIRRGRAWAFDADPMAYLLASEALRIRLAYLFDPFLAVSGSDIEPLPHQITAVYEAMLPRQPLRFLLADDPGAGKTIMAGLFIKELILRGDVERCMIVVPGNLVEQWQDELYEKFGLSFIIMTNEGLESSQSGNWFLENERVICRLDKLARDEELLEKLKTTDWDLIICDEAHKLSAAYYGNEIKYTKRYRLGQALSNITRHFLLMTATPHNGKEDDFQLFLQLIDADRFEGKYRGGDGNQTDAADLMRRLVKEQLVRFDGSPLFPERKAYTVNYELSEKESHLYEAVTSYVRNEFNRADRLENEGKRGNIGFALTMLQRRLASSPAAIHASLRRRRERLESRLREEKILKRGLKEARRAAQQTREYSLEDLEDLEDAPAEEAEEMEEQILDQATAAATIEELEIEIGTLRELEALAETILKEGKDRKLDELSSILQEDTYMRDGSGNRRKLVVFTEHKDTLRYLAKKIGTLLSDDGVVTIYGGMGREERKKAEYLFKQDKDIHVLVATDAAGEGINLQRAHLMVNYDLPWNPNRLEQRFGRIHRIGQTEVCHLWNMVAYETREGDVFRRLLGKLEIERQDLGGRVYDVLGRLFQGH